MIVSQQQKAAKDNMEKAVAALVNELKKVRTGRAQVSMLDPIRVDYYGTMTPLSQMAALSVPDARSLLISPWDQSVLKAIESAIVKSDLGMNPQNDGKVIRLKVPELTEERRKEMVKNLKKTVEDARVAIRMARRDANELIKKAQKDKAASEDEAKRGETDIQKLTDEYIKKVDKIAEDKEKELMTV